MQIVLLSGGSGKRLWPLSNDVRSKQFIKIFKKGKCQDEFESMVQRVYRQIRNVDEEAQVTIATSKKQVSAIKNQLGDRVSVCVEPCRKDTFPAIALAAAYLQSEKKVSEDETVIVCPVDPFVNNNYFQMFKQLDALVKKETSAICLMGIEPTYPSEKYGYIIPETNENISKVKTFKEKPNEKTAEKYLAAGALWNAGVFSFKLGTILERCHKIIKFDNYTDLYNQYSNLQKISFDYAILEKEETIEVVRYKGDWKDLGTWNTFSEAMDDVTLGKVILGKNCVNTNVINELNIPVLCMGLKNTIVAASGDGILISDKEQSSEIKPYVDTIDEQIRFAEKSWGNFTVLDIQPTSMTVKIKLLPGQHLTYHEHEHREEVWTVISGLGKVVLDNKEYKIKEGDTIHIRSECKHSVIAETELDIIEVQIGEEIDVNDKEKFDYNFEG